MREMARTTDGVTVADMQQVLECDDNTARRELLDLEAIGMVKKDRPAKTDIYAASDDLRDYAARVFLDEFEPEESLQKLFDVPNNSISE